MAAAFQTQQYTELHSHDQRTVMHPQIWAWAESMDEQLAMASEPEQSGTYDVEADCLAYGDYSNPITSGDGNITMSEDGELDLSDGFFANTINDEPIPTKMYTPEELQATPFEYWDVNRIEGDVKDYIPIVLDQMEQQMAMRPETPPIENTPRQYTPSELAEAAHELSQQRNAEVAQYQRVARDYQDFQRFNAELVRQQDYAEFDRWFSGKLQAFRSIHAGVAETMEHYAE